MVLQALLPDGDHYWAVWVYDIDDDERLVYQLVTRLTAQEAAAVLERDPYRVGFLEPVRTTMAEPVGEVVVTRFGGQVVGSRTVEVPQRVDEDAFVDGLFDAAQAVAHGAGVDVGETLAMILHEAQHQIPA